MKFLALTIVLSIVLGWLYGRRLAISRKAEWTGICLCIAAGILFSAAFRKIYPQGLYHKSNLIGWFLILAMLTRLIMEIVRCAKTDRKTAAADLCRAMLCLAVWLLICHVFGSRQIRQFPPKKPDICIMGMLAAFGVFSWLWTGSVRYIRKIRGRVCNIMHMLFLFLVPAGMVWLCETAQNAGINGLNWTAILVDIALCALVAYAVFLLVPSAARIHAARILLLAGLITGCANQFLIDFRDMPFMANDIYSITTAATVAGGYTFQLSEGILKAIVYGVFLLAVSDLCDRPKEMVRAAGSRLKTAAVRISGAAACVIILFVWTFTVDFQSRYTGTLYLWQPAETYRKSGFLSSFIVTCQQMKIPKPDGYSAGRAEEILSSGEGRTATATDMAERPSVIVIMNEAFSDLSVLEPMDFVEDHLQFYRSLADDPGTLQYGYDYVSTFGGGTAMTEWEYLTGMSSAFLPGRIAYTQMDQNGVPSLARVFGQQGYRTIAVHPFVATNYRRNTVYQALGFDEFVAMESFDDMETIRDYCSDMCDYRKVLELMEAEDSPVFLFNVTMQNHGGYDIEGIPLDMRVSVDKGLEKYTDLTAYESLLKQSDNALEFLIDTLRKCGRPVVLCFFGDHQPNLTSEFWKTARENGRLETDTDLDIYQKLYAVPYLIWTNYTDTGAGASDDPDGTPDIISPGFMGAMTAETAGIRLTEYLTWLLETRDEISAINSTGYYGNDGMWHAFEEETTYTDTIRDMAIVQYNALVDRSQKLTRFYELDVGTDS